MVARTCHLPYPARTAGEDRNTAQAILHPTDVKTRCCRQSRRAAASASMAFCGWLGVESVLHLLDLRSSGDSGDKAHVVGYGVRPVRGCSCFVTRTAAVYLR